MKTAHRSIVLASVLALGLSSITIPSAQADPVPPPPAVQSVPVTGFSTVPHISVTLGTKTVDSTEVRLITGDVVYVDGDGKITGATPGPRPDGTVPQLTMYNTESGSYVIPSDVTLMVDNQLDRELFNVTRLASYDLDEDSVPVIIAPAEDDSTLTPDVSDLGVDVTHTLDAAAAQAGVADASTESGPAPSWDLISELDTAPTSATDPVSSDTKVWLDREVQIDPSDEPDPNDELEPQWSPPVWMDTIGATDAHAAGYTGEGVTVAVVDTGIDSNHPDLKGQIIAAEDFSYSGTTEDSFGHGTFVASEIAGTGVASEGVYVGVAPGAKLINARVLDSEGRGEDSSIIAGVEWAAGQGADIINLSLGDASVLDDGSAWMSQAINRISQQYGCLIVIAAGNGYVLQSVSSPGTADEALTVGATYQDGTQTWFSSIGPRRGDGAVKPEIMAPGAGLPVFDEYGQIVDVTGIVGAEAGGDGYLSEIGTSMATPLVAGSAALVKQSDPTLDRMGIRAKLMASATSVGLSVFEQGAGLVNIPAAISQTLTTSPTQLNFGKFSLPYADSAALTLSYVNNGSEDLTLELTTEAKYVESVGLPTDVEVKPPAIDSAQPGGATAVLEATDADHINLSASEVVVPPGGTASVQVTIEPSAFEAGYVGGYVIAASGDGTQIRTPFGWGNEPQVVTLSVTATDHNGAPINEAADNFISVVSLQTGINQQARATSGTMNIHVVPGDYVIVAYSSRWNDEKLAWDITYTIHPQMTITDDTAITMDGTDTQPVTLETEKPADHGYLGFEVRFTGGYGASWWSLGSRDTFSNDTTYAPRLNDPDWNPEAQALVMAPLTQAKAGGCDSASMPIESMNTVLAPGEYSYTVSDQYETPAAVDSPQMAIVHASGDDPWDLSVWADRLSRIQDNGYAAAIIDADRALYAASSIGFLVDYYQSYSNAALRIPVFVTDAEAGSQIRTAGGVDVLIHGQMDYVYILWKEFDPSSSGPFAVIGTDETTSELSITHPGMGSYSSVEDWFRSYSQSFWWPIGTSFSLIDEQSYTAYVPADRWNGMSVVTRDDDDVTVTEVIDQLFPTDEIVDLEFGVQVQSPGTSVQLGFIERAGDVIRGPVPLFLNGQGLPEVERSSGFGSVDLTVTDVTAGQTLVSGDGTLAYFQTQPLDPSSHTYRLDMDTTSSLRTLSTDVTSSWTWQSARSDWRSEPLRQVWYELPGLDADNAGGEDQTIVVHSGQQISSDPLPTDTVTLQASTDGGATWSDVPLQYTGTNPGQYYIVDSDLYKGHIVASAGQMVSLRSSVSGGGSSFDQTVMNAYPVTDSPKSYPTPVTWACGGGDVTPPDAPTVNAANTKGIDGTAEPGSTVKVVFPDGSVGQTTAQDDGNYYVDIPAGTASGKISVTATDAAGNVSDPTTAYLDMDRPDPPRIDRADTVEVSGGVGATEAFALVLVTFPDGSGLVTQAAENGSYSVPTTAGMVLGTVTVIAQDDAGNVSDPSTAQLVQPSKVKVSVRSAQLNPGDSQTVTGTTFRPLERVTISLCSVSSCTTVKTVYASLTGRVSTSFTVPKTSVAGTYTVTLTGASSGSDSATFEVVTPPPTPQCWLDYLLSAWLKLLGF